MTIGVPAQELARDEVSAVHCAQPSFSGTELLMALRLATDAAAMRANAQGSTLSPVQAAEAVAQSFLAARAVLLSASAPGNPARAADAPGSAA